MSHFWQQDRFYHEIAHVLWHHHLSERPILHCKCYAKFTIPHAQREKKEEEMKNGGESLLQDKVARE